MSIYVSVCVCVSTENMHTNSIIYAEPVIFRKVYDI